MNSSIIEFKQNEYTGHCLTKCPYGKDCYVNSFACSECIHNGGNVIKQRGRKKHNAIKCTGITRERTA